MNVQSKVFASLIDLAHVSYLSPWLSSASSAVLTPVTTCYLMALENISECPVPLSVPERALLSQGRQDNLAYSWAKEQKLLMMLLKARFPFLSLRVSPVQTLGETRRVK